MTRREYHIIKLSELKKGNLAVLDHLEKYNGAVTRGVIEWAACDVMGLNINRLYQPTRKREVVRVRQVVQWLLAKYTDMSLGEIGWVTGRKAHGTVISSIKTVNDLIDTDPKYRAIIGKIKNYLE